MSKNVLKTLTLRGLYYKTLQIQHIGQLHIKLVWPFTVEVTNTLALTHKLTFYGLCILQIHNIYIVQAQGVNAI